MKLTPSEIASIEKFLSARNGGMTNTAIGLAFNLGAHAQQKASVTFTVLKSLGVRVSPPRAKMGRKRGVPNKPKVQAPSSAPRVQRKFLSAEEWQERLAAQGF